MRRRGRIVASVGLLAFLLGGCSSTTEDPRTSLETKASLVDSATRDVLTAVRAAGFPDAVARGIVEACQGMPDPGVSYRAGIAATIGEDLVSAYDEVTSQLTKDGWKESSAYEGATVDPSAPAGQFTRDDIRVDIKTGGASVGGTPYGEDAMQFGVTIDQSCVRVPEGTHASDFDDLEKTIG